MREDMFYSRIIVRTLISYQKIYITIGWRIYCYGVSDYDHPSSLEEAKDLYISLITLGIRVEGQQWLPANDFKNMLGIIQPMSYVLS